MSTAAKSVIAVVLGIITTLRQAPASAQSVEANPGMNRPVTAQEIERLRQTIHDETSSNLEALFQYHSESGDLNNRLNFYRFGARANLRLGAGALFYVTGVRTPYSTLDQVVEATGTNVTFGLRSQLSENVISRIELGGARFSTGGTTINALGSLSLSSGATTVTFTASRTNVEESLLSATGVRPVSGPFAGEVVGQVMDNRVVVDGAYRLSPNLDAFGSGGLGYREGVNVDSNSFLLGGAGAGYNIISAPADESISLLRGSYELNYIGFRDDRLGFGGASLLDARGRSILTSRLGSDGISPLPASGRSGVGGYFSPENFFSHVIRGELRGRPGPNLDYQVSGFVGSQYFTGSPRRQALGFSGTVSFRLNDRYSVPITLASDNYGPFTQRSLMTRLIVRF